MATDITVPTLGESVTEATVARWLKAAGSAVAADEPLVELETDKVTLEVNAPTAGTLSVVLAAEGSNVEVGAVLGRIADGAAAGAETPQPSPPAAAAPVAEPVADPPPLAQPAPAPAAHSEQASILVPTLGESVTEATVAKWLKAVGDAVAADEAVVELETDKVTLEVNAPTAGTLSAINADAGATVEVGAVLGLIGGADGAVQPAAAPQQPATGATSAPPAEGAAPLSPAVRKMVDDNRLDPSGIPPTGKDGRLTKEDVVAYLERQRAAAPAPAAQQPAPPQPSSAPAAAAPAPKPAAPPAPAGSRLRSDKEERVRMTRLRQRIAQRLKEAQNTAAMLTTFNEVDMTNVMALRGAYKDAFEKKTGVRLGFMSFFVKACITALKEFPAVNAEIEGTDLVYKNYYDIGVAVGSPQGLVVPVVRDADKMSFAEIEKTIGDLGKRARDGKLTIEELTGGTFTITNGGVFGSLLSTPILNPPQSGILGMHKTMQRPVVVDGKIEARAMMYLALSYDHRIIDGREAVSFLVRVKECIEDPQRLLLAV